MMPAKPDEDRHLDHGVNSVLQSTIYSQPWWSGTGTGTALAEAASQSSRDQTNGSVTNGATHSQGNNMLNKELEIAIVSQYGSYIHAANIFEKFF